jgi:hypothetical protein
MDCRNPDTMDGFELAIHGTGYPLPGGYDEIAGNPENQKREVIVSSTLTYQKHFKWFVKFIFLASWLARGF